VAIGRKQDEAAAAGAEPVADVAPHGNAGGLEVLRLDSAEHDGVANAQSESGAAMGMERHEIDDRRC